MRFIKNTNHFLANFFLKLGAVSGFILFLSAGIFGFGRLVCEADKRSALYEVAHSNLVFLLIATFIVFAVWNMLVIAIEIMITFLSNYDLADKLTNKLYKFGILISLLLSMLYTETPDQFQLLATLISFALIFQFLLPNGLRNLIANIRKQASNKWHKNKYEK